MHRQAKRQLSSLFGPDILPKSGPSVLYFSCLHSVFLTKNDVGNDSPRACSGPGGGGGDDDKNDSDCSDIDGGDKLGGGGKSGGGVKCFVGGSRPKSLLGSPSAASSGGGEDDVSSPRKRGLDFTEDEEACLRLGNHR